METLTIPKFENEADEANWAYENRDGLATHSCKQHKRPGAPRDAEGTRRYASHNDPPRPGRHFPCANAGRAPRPALPDLSQMLIHEGLEREERLAS